MMVWVRTHSDEAEALMHDPRWLPSWTLWKVLYEGKSSYEVKLGLRLVAEDETDVGAILKAFERI